MSTLRVPGLASRLSIITVLALAFAAGCGGGGGAAPATGSGGSVGPAAIAISLNAGSGTNSLAASATAADLAAGYQSARDLGAFRHVYMEVVKIALLPVNDSEFDGEDMEVEDGPGQPPPEQERSGWVKLVPSSPTVIDLLSLQNGKKLARLLNHFDSVPAGTYNKIRVFYRDVRVVLNDNTGVTFHPTAHSHFDLHFVNGHELVIPVSTDTTYPDSWVKFFKVKLDVVGLMIRIVNQGHNWRGAKVILRPQIFAEFVPPILYSIAGRALNVDPANTALSGTFDIDAVGRTFHASYGDTTAWSFSDNVLAGSDWTVDVTAAIGFQALQDRAIVEAIGQFDSGLVFVARDIAITFPDERGGVVDGGWRADNTFVIRQAGDNVVFPRPSRAAAYYDNAVLPHAPLPSSAIDNNVRVRARGYTAFDNGAPVGINAFWISIGP